MDSRNILVDKDEYKVGDSVVITVDKQEIKSVIKLKKGACVVLLAGKHIGNIGIIEDITGHKVIININDKKIETLTKYAFAVGKGKAEIKLSD